MRIHELLSQAKPKAKRVGRGISAGQGKTAGRGTKGQKARTGASSKLPRTFRGGSTPLVQSLPKMKGFTSHRVKPVTVNMAMIAARFEEGSTVTLIDLIEHGIVTTKEARQGVKVVGASGTVKNITLAEDLKTSTSLQK